jgi:hypothetical protein
MSVSLPTDWFVTQNLTNVIDPVQLFAIANMPLPTQQKNVQGVANPTLIPTNATLVMVSAFSLTPDMAAWNLRSSETPSAPSLASLGPGHPYGNVGLLTRSWTVYGMQWAVEGLVWIGTAATNADIATIDAVLQSLSYDEPL